MARMHSCVFTIVLLLAVVSAGADVTSPGDFVRGVPNDGDWPSVESPPLAIDDNVQTKYLHFKGETQATGFQVTPSAGATVVTGLTLTTANDAVERDPTAFELSGSNVSIDGPYTLIARGDIVDFSRPSPWPRFTKNETPITFANKTAYAHYQLLFTSVRNAAWANSMQIAEVEFLGTPAGGLPPEVDAGADRTVTWRGAGNTIIQMQPTIVDDDPCGVGLIDPDYLEILWSSVGQPVPDFLGTETETEAMVSFPQPGVYTLQLQVWDERDQEGRDTVVISVVEPPCPLGDLSGDCKVDFSDVMLLAEQWLDGPGYAGDPLGCADLVGSDGVTLADFARLAEEWSEDWTGALRVTLTPSEAVAAGARWRLDGGEWLASGAVMADLVPGTYTVDFGLAGVWGRPSARTVQITRGQTTELTATYSRLPDSDLLITELMAINETTLSTKVAGRTVYPDWIEIHNGGTGPVDLAGWYLTDDPDNLTMWPLPAIWLAAGQSLVIFASGVQEEDHPGNWPYRDDAGYYHANFSLSGEGEYLALVRPDLQVAHAYGSPDGAGGARGYPPQQVDLSYGIYGSEKQYFTQPTPGSANGPGYVGISEPPIFSHPGGTFRGYILLELSSPNPNAEIRVTTDGQVPTLSSRRYTDAIAILGTREVVARAYEPDKAPSAAVSQTYIALADDVADFSSDLPIVIVDTSRQNISTTFRAVRSAFIDRGDDGRARMLDRADYVGRGGLKRRGRSTINAPKGSYGFEVWDENNLDKDVSIFGMPADSDWILYAPFNYDRALINNALMHELSNQIGRYSVRTRFVEMYLNSNDDTVSASDYVGLYIFMEKIKRGPERVDIEKLEPWQNAEPAISGGYMLKIDRPDDGDSGFRTARGNPTYGDGTLCYVDPKESEITTAQSAWIRGYLNAFEDALYGPNFADPVSGYARYIDVDSFIDHNLLNMLAMNVDALRLSTHLHKNRNGKLEMGPLWDFDRALNSTDGRDDNPERWRGTGDGTDYLGYIWWDRLFEDANFWQKYIDRWFALRKGAFSTESLNATIDAMADEIREAQLRNFQKWPGQGPRYGGFQGEIDQLKQWLARRCAWVDSRFVAPPQIVPEAGHVEAGTQVSLVNTAGSGVIYYTLDGSDPRPPQAAPAAIETVTLVPVGAAKRVLVPTGPVDDAWRGGSAFDDAAWISGSGGVGYEASTGYEQFFSIDVRESMYGRNPSCYIRIPFVVSGDPAELNYMVLRARYDDGFVAYLNGVEIQRTMFSGTPAWNSSAEANHDDMAALLFEDFEVSLPPGLLRAGANVLAIHGLNSSASSSDFLISVELVAGHVATPGAGQVSGEVYTYEGPITITASTQIKARVLVASNQYSPWSGLAEAVLAVGPVAENLRISELMYHPADPNTEFIELTNVGAETIDLNLVRFTAGVDFTFPGVELAPGEYVLVVENAALFEARYGQGFPIAGEYNGNLANGGEYIELQDAAGQIIHGFRYGDRWYDQTDGQGFSLTVTDPATVDPNRLGERRAWRPSMDPGGSPGFADGAETIASGSVVINELMANPEPGQPDWIELHNTTNQTIDIGGWFLSDNANDLNRYRIASGTTIGPGGFVVFFEDRHFGNEADPGCQTPFGLSRTGETLYLHCASEGSRTGYSEQQAFDASERGVSLGRHLDSTEGCDFVSLVAATPGEANAEPKVGPIVINEIMYNPAGLPDAEYVELLNVSDSAVTLYDATRDALWRFTDDPEDPGIELVLPVDPPVTLQTGQCLLLVKDITAFNATYAPPAGVRILQWGGGRLANGSETVQIAKPVADIADQGEEGPVWIPVDRVAYSDGDHPDDFAGGIDPWPAEADGRGASLRRIDSMAHGNDPANWRAAAPSPGLAD
ncbi:MAG TPA: CotH kinase family protein [Sedimentisphaerales bacterium]|nr:CotH kinase family protein [Sedimentisphaerales bacterium]HRS09728.1 CotH kinase family protein [Sedimentisphaerales bacterium]HRV46622.1 CotH kinase family protein [Sedimentisphaerales bacterium]